MTRVFIILIAAAVLFCQCKGNDATDEDGSDYPSLETFAAIDSCMSFMSSDTERAHRMLDSLKDEGLMTSQRCDYYHAMVVYNGERNLDSALVICDRLLDEGKFGDDAYLEEEICVLASDISGVSMRHVETLRYANRGIAICHGNEKMRDDEAVLMGRMGAAQHRMGKVKEARATYANAYELLKRNSSFADFVALISLKKKEAGLCFDAKDYDGVIAICQDILGKVEQFDRNPAVIKQRPESMAESGSTTHEFADFYQCQMYGRIAKAYYERIADGASADAHADTDSVKAYMDRWSSTKESEAPENIAPMLRVMLFAGMKAEFDNAKDVLKDVYRNDSIESDYVDYLTIMADEAAASNDMKASNSYLRRALAVSDSLIRHETAKELSEQMSLYMVQENQLARKDAEGQLARQKLISVTLSIGLLIVLMAGFVIIMLYRRNKRNEEIIEMAQQDLNEQKEEIADLVQQLDEVKTEQNAFNTMTLYDRIVQVLDEDKLYLNPELDIRMLADAVGSNRSNVSRCINSITGKTFRMWISEYRLSLFVSMLKEYPEESIDVIAASCGYKEQSTFRRQFKIAYGMTPGEYRRNVVGGE